MAEVIEPREPLNIGRWRRASSGSAQGNEQQHRTQEDTDVPVEAVGFGLAAVESAAASVVALTCGLFVVGGSGWL
jgi:hypothetical protein